MKDNP